MQCLINLTEKVISVYMSISPIINVSQKLITFIYVLLTYTLAVYNDNIILHKLDHLQRDTCTTCIYRI